MPAATSSSSFQQQPQQQQPNRMILPTTSDLPMNQAAAASASSTAAPSFSSLTMVPDTERMAVGGGDPSLFFPGARPPQPTRDAATGQHEDEPAPSEEAVEEAAFNYRVVCEDGAYVRVGLELSSRHIYTVGSQSVVEVTERCVNNQGLARLRTADGWISEMLNPLSGQRGPIVELVPLRRPLKFRVVYPSGALVRSGVELSSSVVGSLPQGEVVVVNEKRYSNTPSYRCVPRLRLADGSGWISVRINSPPPEDHPVVQLLGFAEEADLRAYAAALLDPPMADGAGMVEMEEGDEGGYSEGEGSEGGSSYLDESDGEDAEGQGAEGEGSGAELLLTGEESRDVGGGASLLQEVGSEGASPPQGQRRRRRRRHDELSSPLGSSGRGGSGMVMADGQVSSSSSSSSQGGGGAGPGQQQRPVPVLHFHRHRSAPAVPFQGKPGAGAGEGKAGGGSGKPRWPQQTQQHEAHADNDKILRALGLGGAAAQDDSCLVCFSSARTATFVHGETGHISCCLECARVLKGRGDPCPVCRLPIDRVIQHFWT